MADSQTETVVIPIGREELRVSKREVETGRVRVRTAIEERQEMVREDLTRSTVEIERVPVDREVETMPAVRTEDGVTVIPVVEEILFVRKALVLVEEIRLHRQTSVETVEEPVTLRTQRAVVEREDMSGNVNS